MLKIQRRMLFKVFCLLLNYKISSGFGFRFGLDINSIAIAIDDVRRYKRRCGKATEQDGQAALEIIPLV
jgi:hypothetical protein